MAKDNRKDIGSIQSLSMKTDCIPFRFLLARDVYRKEESETGAFGAASLGRATESLIASPWPPYVKGKVLEDREHSYY